METGAGLLYKAAINQRIEKNRRGRTILPTNCQLVITMHLSDFSRTQVEQSRF